MEVEPVMPPRAFEVGFEVKRTILDCARIRLRADEQVTFVTEDGAEYDLCRKDFGFYATPSLNGRLPRCGLRPVLVRNRDGKCFLLLVEHGRETLFDRYCTEERLAVLGWLDTDAAINGLLAEQP